MKLRAHAFLQKKEASECKHVWFKNGIKKISAISCLPVSNGQNSGRTFFTVPLLIVRHIHLEACKGLSCHLLVISRLRIQETATHREKSYRSLAEAVIESENQRII